MKTTREQQPNEQEGKAKVIALIAASGITGALFLMTWMWTFITPIPPFPESPKEIEVIADNGISDEQGGGFTNAGGGSVQGDGGQKQETGSASNDANSATAANNGGNITSDAEPSAAGASNPKPVVSNTPEASDKLKDLVKSLGQGNSSSTTPTGGHGTGDPYSSGGDGGGRGPGSGPGLGPGTGGPTGVGNGPGVILAGRSMVFKPKLVNTTNEEGTVVVEIVVDRSGKVIKATVLSLGSTTLDPDLRTLARQGAYQWKFDPNPEADEEQIGKITYNFTHTSK